MKTRQVSLLVGVLVAGVLSPLAAQEPVQAPDTASQGYAPTVPVPNPPPAAAVRTRGGHGQPTICSD